jgi:group I intron endonuclease
MGWCRSSMSVSLYTVTRRETGEQYVGLSHNPVRRWSQHETDVRRGSHTRFHNALRKYGINAFDWQIQAQLPSHPEAQIAERILIALLRPVYNLTLGGEGTLGLVASAETRRKLSAAGKKRRDTEETKRRRSVALTGYKHSDETRANMRAAAIGKKVSPEARARMSAVKLGHPPTGPKKHSDETRQKMREAHLRRWASIKMTAVAAAGVQ